MLSTNITPAATNVSDVEQEEYCNKAPYVVFFSSNQEELIFIFISPNLIRDSPQFG